MEFKNKSEAEIREWLKSREVEGGAFEYKCFKSAIIGSLETFGFMTIYEDKEGKQYWFCNGRKMINAHQ